MRLSVFAIVSATLYATAFGQSIDNDNSSGGLSGRLNTGSSFTRKDFDSIVHINLGNKKAAIQGCTGVLISPRHVLTQNVCLVPDPYNVTPSFANMTVTIGKTSSSSKKTLYKFSVVEAYGSDMLVSAKASSNFAILTLDKDVKSSIAKPAKLYGGDYKVTTPAMLIGVSTTATGNSTASLNKMRYENLKIASSTYCLGSNRVYDEVGEICSLVKSGLNTCKGDFGAPVFTPVDNDGTESEELYTVPGTQVGSDTEYTTKKPAKAKAYALLALTSDSITPGQQAPGASCSNGGSTGYYNWVYPFIDQIAELIEQSTSNMTLVNSTLSDTADPFLHPDIVTTLYGGVAKTASLSAVALLVCAAAAFF
ncbi:hypothetical protein GGI20_004669 [Coemansia sp. BCRC 34301]|nr:hypothetical protein GGI20_004669 [Coemansia sp. BCRC 34301]